MFHKSKKIISAVLCVLFLAGCSSVELEQHVTDKTMNDLPIQLDIPADWVYQSDSDMMFFAKTKEDIENDEWFMMLSSNLISTLGEDLSTVGVAEKLINQPFEGNKVTTEKLNRNCIWGSIEASELSYFVVTDFDSGIYIYGRTYNGEVDEETGKAIADSIRLGE